MHAKLNFHKKRDSSIIAKLFGHRTLTLLCFAILYKVQILRIKLRILFHTNEWPSQQMEMSRTGLTPASGAQKWSTPSSARALPSYSANVGLKSFLWNISWAPTTSDCSCCVVVLNFNTYLATLYDQSRMNWSSSMMVFCHQLYT